MRGSDTHSQLLPKRCVLSLCVFCDERFASRSTRFETGRVFDPVLRPNLNLSEHAELAKATNQLDIVEFVRV